MKTSGKALAVLALAAALIFGSVAYYFNRADDGAQSLAARPPALTLNIGNSLYQGQVVNQELACNPNLSGHKFTAQDVTDYVAPASAPFNTLKIGEHLYHSDRSLSVGSIIESIQPVADNKVLLIQYKNGEFKTYPFVDGKTALSLDDVIERDNVFILISCQESRIYDIKDETAEGELPSVLYAPSMDKEWILVPQTGNIGDLAAFSDKLVSVFYQNDEGYIFAPLDSEGDGSDLNPAYKTMWLRLNSDLVAAARASDTADDGDTEGTADDSGDAGATDSDDTDADHDDEEDGTTGSTTRPGNRGNNSGLINQICIKNPSICNDLSGLRLNDKTSRNSGSSDDDDDNDTAGNLTDNPADGLPSIEDLELKNHVEYKDFKYNDSITLKLAKNGTHAPTISWDEPDDITIVSYEVYYLKEGASGDPVKLTKNYSATNASAPYYYGPYDKEDKKAISISNLGIGQHWFGIVYMDNAGNKSQLNLAQVTNSDEANNVVSDVPIKIPTQYFIAGYEEYDGEKKDAFGEELNGFNLSYIAIPIENFSTDSLQWKVTVKEWENGEGVNRKSHSYEVADYIGKVADEWCKSIEDIQEDSDADYLFQYADDEDCIDGVKAIGGYKPFFYTVTTTNENTYLVIANIFDEREYDIHLQLYDADKEEYFTREKVFEGIDIGHTGGLEDIDLL